MVHKSTIVNSKNIMATSTIRHSQRQEAKVWVHRQGRYVVLNDAEQTPVKYSQKYRVGTGIAVIDTPNRKVIYIPKSSHNKFLKMLLTQYPVEQIVAVKWVPNRVMSREKLIQQKCLAEACVRSCVQPGCICLNGVCKNGEV
jgi:hypothetical protein